jgi:hypothetical protein
MRHPQAQQEQNGVTIAPKPVKLRWRNEGVSFASGQQEPAFPLVTHHAPSDPLNFCRRERFGKFLVEDCDFRLQLNGGFGISGTRSRFCEQATVSTVTGNHLLPGLRGDSFDIWFQPLRRFPGQGVWADCGQLPDKVRATLQKGVCAPLRGHGRRRYAIAPLAENVDCRSFQAEDSALAVCPVPEVYPAARGSHLYGRLPKAADGVFRQSRIVDVDSSDTPIITIDDRDIGCCEPLH